MQIKWGFSLKSSSIVGVMSVGNYYLKTKTFLFQSLIIKIYSAYFYQEKIISLRCILMTIKKQATETESLFFFYGEFPSYR